MWWITEMYICLVLKKMITNGNWQPMRVKPRLMQSKQLTEVYFFPEDVPMIPELVGVEVDTLKQEYYLRAIMISKWNKETVWGIVKNHFVDRVQKKIY